MKRLLLTLLLVLASFASVACAHAGRLAEVTLVERTSGRVLPVNWHEGRAWVAGQPGAEYRILVRNTSGGDLLAVVSVDGVNVVTGATAATSQSGYVIDAGGAVDIQGWRKSLAHTAAFYFTRLPDSYAARTGRPDNVGVIGVALYRRKVEPPVALAEPFANRRYSAPADAASGARAPAPAAKMEAMPAQPAAPRAEMAERESRLGTGHGRRETSHARYVGFERATAEPEEIISVNYDSRANLVALGVLAPEPPRWADPQPFPAGFVPDPPRRRGC